MERRTFDIPLSIQGPFDAFWEEAKEAGVALGQDFDWEPTGVDAALLELVLYASPRIAYADPHRPHYVFRIVVDMDEDRFIEHGHEDGFWDQRGLEASLLAALQSEASPVDMGFEIMDIAEPNSAHGVLAQRAALEAVFSG